MLYGCMKVNSDPEWVPAVCTHHWTNIGRYVQSRPRLTGPAVPSQSEAHVTGAGSGWIVSSWAVVLRVFGRFEAVIRSCPAYDEVCNYFRSR